MDAVLEEQTIDASAAQLADDFGLLIDWEDRYSHVIDLGKKLPKGDGTLCCDDNKVEGCVSQVWIKSHVIDGDSEDEPRLRFEGESDASIVRGLIAIVLHLYSGRRVGEILSFDANDLFTRLSLEQHLSPQRSNGLHSMLRRIRADALAAKNKT
ncbi:MAG: SufE family protein [Hyphomicrobiales bacterium]|nr:SufE family protein [Hyphomicrobiales bacterium]